MRKGSIMQSVRALLWAIAAIVALPAAAWAAQASLTGEVTYREKIALPPDARLVVRLLDVSRHDTRPMVHAEAPIAPTGKIPLQFTLRFDDGLIIPSHRYGLDIAIMSGSQMWFHTAEPFAVDPLAPTPAPVVTVAFVGTITNAPATKPSQPPSILDTRWRVTTIDGNAMPRDPEITLLITGEMRAGGRGGCNSYFTQAVLDGAKLAFSPVAATRMACPDQVMARENAFFAALPTVAAFMLDGANLELYDASGKQVLVLTRAGNN